MNKKILIIEDNENHQFLLKDLLEDEGYEIIEMISDGIKAFEKVNSKGFEADLIITDIGVPNFDAVKFIVDYKGKFQLLVVSRFADRTDVIEAVNGDKNNKDDKYLIKKPFDCNVFIKKVHLILDGGGINE